MPLPRETGMGRWLLFARETSLHRERGFDRVVGADVVRNSAFLFGAGGERVAPDEVGAVQSAKHDSPLGDGAGRRLEAPRGAMPPAAPSHEQEWKSHRDGSRRRGTHHLT